MKERLLTSVLLTELANLEYNKRGIHRKVVIEYSKETNGKKTPGG
jgi:hypothetical protein